MYVENNKGEQKHSATTKLYEPNVGQANAHLRI